MNNLMKIMELLYIIFIMTELSNLDIGLEVILE
jgi:hypothetical protein